MAVGMIAAGVLIAVAAVGCRQAPATATLAQQFLDALNAHDADRVLALLGPGATYEELGRPESFDAAAFRELLDRQWSVWRDQVYSARHVHTFPEGAVIEWVVHQTYQNQDAVSLEGAFVLDTRDGRIGHVRNYFDATPLLRFLKPKPS